MKTYTAVNRQLTQSIKVRARSNKQACEFAGRILSGQYRVFQGGWGYDSGWIVRVSVYAAAMYRL